MTDPQQMLDVEEDARCRHGLRLGVQAALEKLDEILDAGMVIEAAAHQFFGRRADARAQIRIGDRTGKRGRQRIRDRPARRRAPSPRLPAIR